MHREPETPIRALWERGRAAWPTLELPFEVFEGHARTKLAIEDAKDGALHAEDLYLACACLVPLPGAAELFAEHYERDLARFVRSVERRAEVARELVHEQMIRMLVGDGESGPRLAEYSGRGPLRAWLRMSAVRRTLNATRDKKRRAEIEARIGEEAIALPASPELAVIRERYRPALEQALRDAMASLPSAERALLRLYYGEQLDLGTIAKMYGWSKPTASRRVSAARAAVQERVMALLHERLAVGPAELESLVGLLRSQLAVSLTELFGQDARRA